VALTVVQVRNLKAGRHADGKGLYLLVKPSGARSWVLRIQHGKRRRDLGLGSVLFDRRESVDHIPLAVRRELTLAEARDKATFARTLVKAGRDPSAEWRKARVAIPTFEEAANEYHRKIKSGFRNARHSASWLTSLEMHAFPKIGRTRVDEVDTPAIQSALLPIWLDIPETARRVRQRVLAVLDYAHAQHWREAEAPTPKRVSSGLPKQPKADTHFSAVPYADVPALVGTLRSRAETTGRLALQFLILTAARSGEVRGATWKEFEESAWNLPGTRMKAGRAHSVPLSPQALKILERARELTGGLRDDLVFPGSRGKPLSDMTMSKALKDAGSDATVHGFRSSFRDWAAEQTSFPQEWAEAALAHSLPNKVEAAYRRTQFFEQRRKLMGAWGAYVDSKTSVVSIGRGRRSKVSC
jgi:integrase